MTVESAKKFCTRMLNDTSFRDGMVLAKRDDRAPAYLEENGLKFSQSDLDKAKAELGIQENAPDAEVMGQSLHPFDSQGACGID